MLLRAMLLRAILLEICCYKYNVRSMLLELCCKSYAVRAMLLSMLLEGSKARRLWDESFIHRLNSLLIKCWSFQVLMRPFYQRLSYGRKIMWIFQFLYFYVVFFCMFEIIVNQFNILFEGSQSGIRNEAKQIEDI